MELIQNLNENNMSCCCDVCQKLELLFINTSPIDGGVFISLLDETNGCSRTTLSNLLSSSFTVTDDQDCLNKKKIGGIDILGDLTEFFESITGFGTPTIDVTDPYNVEVSLPFTNEECTVQDVEFIIPIPNPVSVFNSIDLKFDANGDLIVEAVYTDDDGNQSTITDTTPVTLPANEDYVLYTGNNNVPVATPPNGVDTAVLADGTRYDWDGSTWILSHTPCPEPMTRAQLIALRNASGLDPQCHYIITNPNANGNLQVESILIHALNENTLSGCYIKTQHDNTAWNGSYDIDTDRVEYIHDHLRNNIVHVNASIILFPFGVASVTGNVVNSNARLIYNGGSVNNNNFSSSSITTVNSGTFRENIIAGEATNVTVSTTGVVEENTITSRATLTITGSAAFARNNLTSQARVNTSKTCYRNNFTSYCNVILSGTGQLNDSDIHNESTLNISSTVTTEHLTMKNNASLTLSGTGAFNNSTISEDSVVTISSQNNYNNIISGRSTYNQVGTGWIRYTTIDNQSSVTNGNTNIGQSQINSNTTINTTGATGDITRSTLSKATVNAINCPAFFLRESEITSLGSINCNNSARVYFYRGNLNSYGRLDVRTGSRIDSSYTQVSSNSYLQSTIDGGFLTVNNTNVSGNSYVRNITANANTVSNCIVGGQSNMRFDGDSTGGRIYYSSALSGTSVYQTTGSVNCYMYYVNGSSVAQIYSQTSTNLRMYYSSCSSYSYLRAIGNATTLYMYYCNADARGYVQALNNIGTSRMYAVDAAGQAIAELRGSTGNLYYSSFSSYFYGYITRTAGTATGLFGMGRRSQTITDTAAIVPYASGTAWLNF